jgi:hypothetical protein
MAERFGEGGVMDQLETLKNENAALFAMVKRLEKELLFAVNNWDYWQEKYFKLIPVSAQREERK